MSTQVLLADILPMVPVENPFASRHELTQSSLEKDLAECCCVVLGVKTAP